MPETNGSAVLEATGLRKEFGDLVAVDDVSFRLLAGRSLAIVGESGSGKTTIARMIVGLERPTGGTITACGHDRSRPVKSARERRRRGREVQIVFQDPYTAALAAARPDIARASNRLRAIPGRPLSAFEAPPAECAFAPRCAHASDICRQAGPEIAELDGGMSRCARAHELRGQRDIPPSSPVRSGPACRQTSLA